MTTVTQPTICPGYEPIPGYRLLESIGSGGFGEVWRVEAPGGLHKALKFVHGALGEHQATRELRSLERIKGVHHPFLLTLERFEVVDGRLVIVTELADGSLEDVLRRHRDRGSCGIPRAALLAYLHDAADALDYLHDRYQLQHLDVKPGNLLMVGGHVKVADFGLLKDLRDVDCSVIGGLTPIYAPPEVFDGRPSAASDQYSLAVMYQELLTGVRPFSGRTIAQLATQHVHSAPNLEPLPPADRPVVARALEKNPARRYSGCLEFVEALRSAADRGTRVRQEGARLDSGGASLELSDTRTGPFSTTGHATSAPVEDLPRLSTVGAVAPRTVHGHALVVAVGGTGAECLHRLRQRAATLHAECPLDLHCVLIDTDPETVEAARVADASEAVPPCTAIHIPLRTPQQYRDGGTSHLSSVSRRWLYNVPRSGRTEGLRPLGRLALVDHGAQVMRQLKDAVAHLAAVCGEATPRVYLVGSLGGGTSSGTVWDLAHLLRHLLDDQGLPCAAVTPLLTTPALEASLRNPLATADAHAALAEMHHYMMPGNSYPGDASAGWPGVPAARSPLAAAYVVAAHDSTVPAPTSVEMISDYIWADSTVAGSLLEAARDAGEKDPGGASVFEPMLRSVGVVPLQRRGQIESSRLARRIATRVLHDWLGRPAEARQLAGQLYEKLARRCGLDIPSLVAQAWSPLPSAPQPCIAALAARLRRQDQPAAITPEGVEAAIWETGFPRNEEPARVTEGLNASIQTLRHEMAVRMQDQRLDLTTALECLTRIAEEIQAAAETSAIACQRHRGDAADAEAALRANAGLHAPAELIGSPSEPGPALRFALLRLIATVDGRLSKRLGQLAERLRELVEMLTDHAANVAAAIQCLGEPRGTDTAHGGDPWQQVPDALRARREQVFESVHQAVASAWLASPVREDRCAVDGEAIALATSGAAREIVDAWLDRLPGGGGGVPEPSGSAELSIDQAVRAVRPALLVCGGQQRLLLLVGNEAERAALQSAVADAHGGTLSVAVVPGVSPMLVHEAQRIPLADLLSRLASILGGDQQISARLQTRSDIRWNGSH